MLSGKIPTLNAIYAEYHGDNLKIELEAKFGSFFYPQHSENIGLKDRFNSSVKRPHFEKFRKKLLAERSLEIFQHTTVDYNESGDIRRIKNHQDDSITWQNKQRITDIDIKEYGVRVSVSKEIPMETVSDFKSAYSRERFRYSYIIEDGNVQIDMTDVTTTNKKSTYQSFEVEAEFIGKLDKLSIFSSSLNKIFRWLYSTNVIYTVEQKNNLITDINAVLGGTSKYTIDSRNLVEARNLRPRDLVWGGLIGNTKGVYTVAYKTDGERKLCVLHKSGIWLIYPPFEYNLVQPIGLPDAISIFDGELVDKPQRRNGALDNNAIYWFICFDCLVHKNDISIQIKSHKERMKTIEGIISQPGPLKGKILTLGTKTFHALKTPADFFQRMRLMFNERDLLPYEEDGLIFTPDFAGYNPHLQRIKNAQRINSEIQRQGKSEGWVKEEIPLHERVLTKYADICKWKPQQKLTIDFLIKRTQGIELYSYDSIQKKNVLFQGSEINPFTDQIDRHNPLNQQIHTGQIVEYQWNTDQQLFIPYRIRNNKNSPNRLEVAIDNWDLINSPITEEDLRGDNLSFVYRYFNKIKTFLINQLLLKNDTVLDIGSGKGGDVNKWRKLGSIVAIEPDSDNRQELHRRITLLNMHDKVTVVPTVGQDVSTITSIVNDKFSGKGVDGIILMLSLSFFWENSDILESLVQLIVANLKQNGKIIFLTIDGDAIEQLFEPIFGGSVFKEIQINQARLTLFPRDNIYYGRRMHISLPGTIVGEQDEYLVKLGDLQKRLLSYDIVQKEIHRADKERFLTADGSLFARLYSYGYFIRNSPLQNIIVPKMISRPTPSEVSISEVSLVKKPQPKYLSFLDVYITNEMIRKNQPGKNDDTYEPVKCQWFTGNLVRIACIGDGSCFIHAVCKAFYPKYQENNGSKDRLDMAAHLRRDLAYTLNMESREYPGHTYWETTGRGIFPELLIGQLLEPNSILELQQSYSLQGLQRMFNSSIWLGDASYLYISDMFGIDIYIMIGVEDDLIPVSNTVRRGIARNSIIIMGTTTHYEVIGLDTGKEFQTLFTDDDQFLQAVRNKFTDEGKDIQMDDIHFDPDQNLYDNITKAFPKQSITEIINKYSPILGDSDPFIKALRRIAQVKK